MTKRNSSRLLLSLCSAFLFAQLLLLNGCDKNALGTIEWKGNPPYASTPQITPDSVNVDMLSPVNGTYSVGTDVNVRVSDPEGPSSVQSVFVEIVRPAAEESFLSSPLHDDGRPPDLAANDGMYSGRLQFDLTRAQTGMYRVQFFAKDNAGLLSNVVEKSFTAQRNNSAPRLSNLSAPDTVTVPVGGSLNVHITVTAADSDGLADIRQVYFRSLTSSTPEFKFFLKDDGGTDPPGQPLFVASGDSVAGDGRYSILIPLRDGPTVRRRNTFAFQAIDTFGDTSATLIHYLTVK